MSRRARIIFGIVGALVVGSFVAWRLVRYRFYVDRAKDRSVDPVVWEILRAKPDDPRTMVAAAHELASSSYEDQCGAYERLKSTAEPILAKHPTNDDPSLDAIVRIVRQCPDRHALEWTSRPASDVVKALHKDIVDNYRRKPELSIGVLVELNPVVDQMLVDVIVSSVTAREGPADAFLQRGIPANGQKLDRAPTDPKRDGRIAQGIMHWMNVAYAGLNDEEAAAILRVLDWIPPPPLTVEGGESLGSALRGTPGENLMKLCQKLVRANSKPYIAKYASPANAASCFAGLATLDDAASLLAALPERYDFATGTSSEKDKGRAWADEQAAVLVKLGPKVIPVLRDALTDPKLSARAVASRAFVKLDAKAFAIAEADALRRGPPTNGFDAELAMELVPDEIEIYFAALRTDSEVANRAGRALRQRVKPEIWVPRFFTHIVVGDSFSKNAVDQFIWLLTGTDGVAPHVASALEKELAAAGGKPEDVYWLKKLLGLTVLEQKGTSAQVATVEKFVKDTTDFEKVEKTQDDRGVVSERVEKTTFGQLAALAIGSMRGR